MHSPSAKQKTNQSIIVHDKLAGEIHDMLLDENNNDLAHAFNQACVEISLLNKEIERLNGRVSSGYIRKK